MNFMEWVQKVIVIWGVIILFCLVLIKRYPKLSSGLKKIFKLKKGKKAKKVNYTHEEMIDLITGVISRIDEKNTVTKAINKIRKIVG